MYSFADLDETETVLQKMIDQPEGALVQRLPTLPARKSRRFAQTLAREQLDSHVATHAPAPDRLSTLETEVARLREEVTELRRRLDEVLN